MVASPRALAESRVLSATLFTREMTSSTDALLSSDAALMSSAFERSDSDTAETPRTKSATEAIIPLNDSERLRISRSFESEWNRAAKSPLARLSILSTTRSRGFETLPAILKETITMSSRAPARDAKMTFRMARTGAKNSSVGDTIMTDHPVEGTRE